MQNGQFTPIVGFTEPQMALSFTVQGLKMAREYPVRYRAQNEYGWSDYSPVA